MIKELKELIKQLEIFDVINNYSIEFGLLDGDNYLPVTVTILNTDNSTTETTMSLGEIMYFTELGTMTIPPRPVLKQCILWANEILNKFIDDAFIGVFEENWTKADLENKLISLAPRIEDHIRNQIETIIISNSTLANILNVEDENKYLYDLKKLKNYMRCKIIKNKIQ